MTEHIAHIVATILSLRSFSIVAWQRMKPAKPSPDANLKKVEATNGAARKIGIEPERQKFGASMRGGGADPQISSLRRHVLQLMAGRDSPRKKVRAIQQLILMACKEKPR